MARERSKDSKAGSSGAPEPDDVKYGAAVEEIEQILASIDRDEIDLDELGQKVERAVELLKVCRAKLKATDARVTQVLKDLAQDEAAEAAKAGEGEDDDEGSESEPLDGGEESSEDADLADDAVASKKKPRRKKSEDEELPF